MRLRGLVGTVALLLGCGGPTAAVEREAGGDRETRAAMAEIFEAVRFLLPLSLDGGRFEDPVHRDRVEAALALLEGSASQLAEHAESREPSFAHLARTLAIDAREIRGRYAAGYESEARHLVQTLAETCIACHSRLAASGDAPRSEAFLREAVVETLPLHHRAKLAYATRQFDDALGLYEELMTAPPPPATQLDHEGYLDDYLELSIRVHRDLQRPARSLARFAERDDLAPPLRAQLLSWRRSLEQLSMAAAWPADVEDAERLIDDASRVGEARDALVHYMLASAALHARLEQPMRAEQRARAYYLLGVVESRIGRSFWLSQAEAFLETAIRLAPGRPVASKAYALLEEALIAGYASREFELPPDLQVRLDALRRIASGDPAAAP